MSCRQRMDTKVSEKSTERGRRQWKWKQTSSEFWKLIFSNKLKTTEKNEIFIVETERKFIEFSLYQ